MRNRTVSIVLGVNMQGQEEVLGLWMADNEGAKFWLHVITELRNRGVEDLLIACCDGLKGFPEAIESVFLQTIVQVCVVHMVRNSLRYVAWGNRKAVMKALKPVYRAATEVEGLEALARFEAEWGSKYPSIGKSWRSNWERVSPFFAFDAAIRKAIYTTNAIEALNRQLRKALKPKGHFPHRQRGLQGHLARLAPGSQEVDHAHQARDLALQQLAIHFEGRINI